MELNHLGVLACGALSMILGMLWYGAFFGKKWAEIIGVEGMDEVKKKEVQKAAMPLYLIAFVLALLQAYVLDYLINITQGVSAVMLSFIVWLGIAVPVVAGGSMWNNDSKRISWLRFLIQAGYYLVLLVLFGLILGSGLFSRNDDIGSIPEGVACTMDAMQCPDGRWIGRTGPNCEFVC